MRLLAFCLVVVVAFAAATGESAAGTVRCSSDIVADNEDGRLGCRDQVRGKRRVTYDFGSCTRPQDFEAQTADDFAFGKRRGRKVLLRSDAIKVTVTLRRHGIVVRNHRRNAVRMFWTIAC